MAQIVEVPGVGEVEFPDSMSDADIISAVKGLSARQPVASHAPPVPMAASHQAYTPPPKPNAPVSESAARGGLQGASFGWGDEAAGAIAATLPFLDREATAPGLSDLVVGNTGNTWSDRYKRARDFYRGRNENAQEANPATYLAGQAVGATAPSLVGAPLTGTRALLAASGQGLAQGAGYSDADTAAGLAGDTALGGALGVAGYGTGKILGKGVAWARRAAANRLSTATARAAEQGAEAATAPVNSLEAAARERTANAYRQMERINLALADPALPAADRAALEAFKKTPEYAALLSANARSIATAAPEALAEREAARAVASEARAALPAEIQKRTAELLQPQVKADAKSFAKGWLEPIAWAYGTNKVGELAGLDPEERLTLAAAAGIVGGRTRAGKALWNRISRPGNQAALARTMARLADRADSPALTRTLQYAAPAVAASTIEDGDSVDSELLRALRRK